MDKKENSQFFECLGEIWRDITAIEFLMRSAIAINDNEIEKFPKPPYDNEKVYKDYPDSFSHYSFEIITKKFNRCFPAISIPKELTKLRDAMAHGVIAEINKDEVNQLVKFKESKSKDGNKQLKVEFSMLFKLEKLIQIRQSLKELRRHIICIIKSSV